MFLSGLRAEQRTSTDPHHLRQYGRLHPDGHACADHSRRQEADGTGLFGITQEPQPLIHPNLAELYKQKVQDLNEGLFTDDTKAEAFDLIRSLVGEITLTPDNNDLRIDLKGELTGILSLCSGNKKAAEFKTGGPEQIMAVAGARNHRDRHLIEIPV